MTKYKLFIMSLLALLLLTGAPAFASKAEQSTVSRGNSLYCLSDGTALGYAWTRWSGKPSSTHGSVFSHLFIYMNNSWTVVDSESGSHTGTWGDVTTQLEFLFDIDDGWYYHVESGHALSGYPFLNLTSQTKYCSNP